MFPKSLLEFLIFTSLTVILYLGALLILPKVNSTLQFTKLRLRHHLIRSQIKSSLDNHKELSLKELAPKSFSFTSKPAVFRSYSPLLAAPIGILVARKKMSICKQSVSLRGHIGLCH